MAGALASPRPEQPHFNSWFLSSLFIIRVTLFILFGFGKGALK